MDIKRTKRKVSSPKFLNQTPKWLIYLLFLSVVVPAGYFIDQQIKSKKTVNTYNRTISYRDSDNNPVTSMPTQVMGTEVKQALLWQSFNNSAPVLYSMEIPWPGTHCNGCFSGNTISGGYFDTTGNRKWLIVHAVVEPGNDPPYGAWKILPGNFYESLSAISVGETKLLTDRNESYNFTRLPDRAIAGINAMIFQTDSNSSNFPPENKMLAAFMKDGKIIYLSFEYGDDTYKNGFDNMIETFSFSERQERTYEEMVSEYNILKQKTSWQ